jgi:large subunit ribosomal protein L5
MQKENLKDTYNKKVKNHLYEKFKYNNRLSVPKLEKIVINRGLSEVATNSKVVEITFNQMLAISGQKPVLCRSKKAISNFKLRKDQVIGCKVTLRSTKMFDFMTKFINIVLPKIRDFRGVPNNSFDGQGNYTIGIKEDSIFPEITGDIDRVRGFDITFVTSRNTTDPECQELLLQLGMPFRKK